MSKLAFSSIRPIELDFNGSTGTPDFYKAVINKVEELEGMYRNNPNLADITLTDIILTGTNSRKVFKVGLEVTFASATYVAQLLEEADNVDGLS